MEQNEQFFETKDDRFYEINGRYYPRVTWILGDGYPKNEFFYEWLMKEGANAEKIKDAAAESGTKLHLAIGRMIAGEVLSSDEFTSEEWRKLMAFIAWSKEFKPDEIVAVELTLHSELNNYAGTADFIVKKDGKAYIIDFKTGKGFYNYFWAQTSAYAKAFEEMGYGHIDALAILHLGVKTKVGYKFEVNEDIETAFNLFKAAHVIFKTEHPKIAPKKDLIPKTLKLQWYEDNTKKESSEEESREESSEEGRKEAGSEEEVSS